jgi:CRP/FNR family nitrogen fixation transcriptional regulator
VYDREVAVVTDPNNPNRQLASIELLPIGSSKLNGSHYRRDERIFKEGERAEYVYQVAFGAVRTCKFFADGRRHIGAFHLAGDIFGLETGNHYRFTAEAVVSAYVRRMRIDRLEEATHADGSMFRHVREMTIHNLEHAEDHLLLLGRKNSLERVATFLLEMHRRLPAANVMSLPMSRRDIADYLGITLETVSRALSRLEREGLLTFSGNSHRKIVVTNPDGLAAMEE